MNDKLKVSISMYPNQTSREVALTLGISKTTVNEYRKLLKEETRVEARKRVAPFGDVLMIADTQISPTSRTEHIEALANYIAEHKPEYIVHIGDHWDFPSLSSYASGLEKENRRLHADLEAGFSAFNIIMSKVENTAYQPKKYFVMGNHEDRLKRFIASQPVLEGCFDLKKWVQKEGWSVTNFGDILWLDGIAYTHFLQNPMSGRPVGGSIDNKLNKFPHSFCHGHQQQFQYGRRQNLMGKPHFGVCAGAFYIEDEGYRGSNNTEIRGFTHMRNFVNRYGYSDYDVEFVSMERLLSTYGYEVYK